MEWIHKEDDENEGNPVVDPHEVALSGFANPYGMISYFYIL